MLVKYFYKYLFILQGFINKLDLGLIWIWGVYVVCEWDELGVEFFVYVNSI